MAITLGTHASAGSADSNGVTSGAIDTSGATLIVVGVTDRDGLAALTDSASNTWTALGTYHGTLSYITLYYKAGPTTSGTHTFTATGSGDAPSLAAAAYAGTATASVVDGSATGNFGNGVSTLQPGSITPSADNYLLVTCYGSTDTYSSVSAPFSPAIESVSVGGNKNAIAFAYEIQTTATARNPTWTWGFNVNAAATMACFKVAGGATTRGTPFGDRGTAFNGGRAMQGILRSKETLLWREAARLSARDRDLRRAA